jgi:hypothetical protein
MGAGQRWGFSTRRDIAPGSDERVDERLVIDVIR